MRLDRISLVDGVVTSFLPVDDRGLMYGDGVFRTLRVVDARPLWWDEQLSQLTEDAARLGFSGAAAALWNADLALMADHLTHGVLKLVLTRGSGPRGYCPASTPKIRRFMQYEQTSDSGVSALNLRVCSLRLGWQPRLAGIKHLNRLENVLARAEWNDPDIHEGVLLDLSERVISGVMSNLFIWQQNQLLTPRLNQCGVAGVARARLMRFAREQGLEVKEAELSLQAVFDADEVMMTNSVWGLRRVARLDAKVWPDAVISPRLWAGFNA